MAIKNKDFVKLLKILNKYFNIYINQKDNKKAICLDNVELFQEHSQSIKHIYVYSNKKNSYELWINESPHFSTEYVFFYRNKEINEHHYFFKDLEEEIEDKFVLDCYKNLLNLKDIKKVIEIENF